NDMQFIKKATLCAVVVAAFLLGSAGVLGADVQYHTVQKGDSCYRIARNYGTELSAIFNANGLSHGSTLYPGQTVVVDTNAKDTNNANYTVKKGDSLHTIAKTYGTTADRLKKDNGLSADRIYVGQKILVPQGDNSSSLSEHDIYLMAKMIHAEARGESDLGQIAVGAVIMNRLKSGSFPNTISGVLYQKNQFTAIDDGQFYALEPDQRAYNAAYAAAKGNDPTFGSLFYWNPQKTNNSWLNSKPILARIGNHVFAK
ncbi:MAG: LysM peptidoglycan-binding domain-containing protein, partial [Firmicutes bacterium]|nr:LysM peptidoglycan-binding domain-containing protein [Bacillota bacterium]